ncbi:ABC transporter permease [Pandoraea pnomenusa]|uniref:Putrescine transport system permease protein PotH n=1 Tax=Pandoraea pnomenusa TaxID=93220 RepID=A0A378YX76_9BURK|nr:ABC transporter permease [Pandoraea pnomenusa]AIU28822.1 ABC transporter permease [Pandoraea pnomenusa]SUA81403.1 Putrescine transport system permease protein PotH [Pandoraea pnomenusa]
MHKLRPYLLLAPLAAFLTAFFLMPLAQVLWLSFTEPTPGFANYVHFFADPFYLRVLGMTFLTSLLVTACCLVLGYPLAYCLAQATARFGAGILLVVGMSYWTSFLVRSYAWMIILGNSGPIVGLFRMLGVQTPPELLFTRFSSTLGMVHALLPLMTITLYSVMKKIDPALVKAAANLGANRFAAFRAVFLPLSLPGVVNGCTMVFIVSLGFYVMPVLLGSPSEQMMAGLIGQQMEEFGNFGDASAMAVVLACTTLSLYALYNRFFGLDKLWSKGK